MEPNHPQTVLLVDDDPILRRALQRELEREGFAVEQADGYHAALKLARTTHFDLALVDVQMPEHSGLDVLESLQAQRPRVPVVLMTSYGSIPTAVEGMRLGAVDYLTKPVQADQLIAALKRLPAEPEQRLTTLARAEWDHLQRALSEARGNISETARRLGVPRRTLQRKLRKTPPRR